MQTNLVNITEEAKQYLDSTIGLGLYGRYVRLSVESSGCSGFQYCWNLVNDAANGTLFDDILVVDKNAEPFVAGCEIHWLVEEFGGSLIVKNPNITAECGCGESFAV